jgi:O-antigen/teichoic acid export membrane protein
MAAGDFVNPPPPVALSNYPTLISVGGAVLFTAILVVIAGRFDGTRGVLTISILIVVSFVAVVAYCLIFTIPTDEVTPAVVGGLTAGFGAVVAYWLGRQKDPPSPPAGNE